MKDRIIKITIIILFLSACFVFVAKFGGPELLKFYLSTSLGDCRKIPVYCMSPEENPEKISVPDEYVRQKLVICSFPSVKICIPRGFMTIQENIKKIYRKRSRKPTQQSVIYLFHKPPDFFMGLFPRLKKKGIVNNDYEFLKRVMNARMDRVSNLTDVFFMVMKGIFIADLGPQNTARMLILSLDEKKGFINYNITDGGNYFDAKFIDGDKGFFSIYIKDKNGELDLHQVCAIISTINDR